MEYRTNSCKSCGWFGPAGRVQPSTGLRASRFRSEAGVELEQGLAANVDGIWVHHATTVAPGDQTLTIEAEAKDCPGHERTRSDTWHA